MEHTHASPAKKTLAAKRAASVRPGLRQAKSVMRVLQPESNGGDASQLVRRENTALNQPSPTRQIARQCDQCAEELQQKPATQFPAQSPTAAPSISQPSDPLEIQAEAVAHQVMAKADVSSDTATDARGAPAADSLQRQCSQCEEDSLQRQAEVSLSQPADPLELEADRVADKSMQRQPQQLSPLNIARAQALPKNDAAAEGELQRLCSDCEEEQLQRYAAAENQPPLRQGLWQRVKSAFRTGRQLPQKLVQFFKVRMGYDFSNVQIHTHQQAGETAREINARAFTWRDHLVFAPGEFQPDTRAGRHLLAHELTHVVQQGAALPAVMDAPQVDSSIKNKTQPQPAPVVRSSWTSSTTNAFPNATASSANVASASPVSTSAEITSPASPNITNTASQSIAGLAPQGDARPQLQRNILGDAWDATTGAASAVGGAIYDTGAAVGGALVDAGSAALEVGADLIWLAVEAVAPSALMELINQVREKGFLGYISEKIEEVTGSIFDGLEDQSGFIGTLVSTFARLAASASTILAGLAQGDCEPLFAALRSMRDAVTELATDAWVAISDFFRPIGEFFSNLWARFGAPVIEWLQQVAGEAWQFIQDMGNQIWAWVSPVVNAIRRLVSDAWGWIKAQLGLPDDEGNSQSGLIQWIQGKAQEAWDAIKTRLAPVIEPIQAVVARVQEILPLEAILNFRETLNGWLQQVAETARTMDTGEGGDVAENQDSLRELLPAILLSIQNFRTSLVDTGAWVADKVGSAVDTGKTFLTALASTPLVSGIASVFSWLSSGLDSIGSWARDTVQGLFTSLGNGLVYLSQFIEPVLNALRRIVEVVGDLLGRIPDFLLGPVWMLLPECIKNPIKNFFIEQILGRIPLFQQLVAAGDIWQRVQSTAIAILRQIFVDGDLFGAAWRFFREMLGLIGIPAQLLVQIVANAAQAFSDILMDPLGFLGNLLRAMWQGTSQFFGNILTHLFGGVTDWLFGQISEAGLTPPDITSFRSVIGFVFDLLGLTLDNIWRILAEHVGQPMVDRLRAAVEFASGAFEFIQVAVTEGLPGLWRLIQERISDLWNMVLNSAVGWINTAIIQTASRWLLSLLDVTGIMPVINSLIAIYHAIESFAQYMVQMLEIVNSVVAGIGDIARGMLDTAANYLESVMAQSIPIVVGFLANQFGLGRLGERVRELVESIRERVNNALDSIVGAAVRAGRAFLDMLRAGAAAVRNWWESRKEFRDATGHAHELYFQSERGELIVASDPTPVAIFLQNLSIAPTDPQRAQKETHKAEALRAHQEVQRIRQTLERSASGADTTELRNQLNQKMDLLATHLTPLLGVGDTSGRLPNPLTLATLNDAPVTTPRTPAEEQIDLNGGRQLVMLAMETCDGTDTLAEYFLRIKTRLALADVAYETANGVTRVKLHANQQVYVDVNKPLKGTSPALPLSSNIAYTQGVAAGDTVGVGMVANPVGPDKINQGSRPSRAALAGVMGHLVTNPRRNSVSRYIKGHLLNHHIGGPGDNTNMYPITAAANSSHLHSVETTVKEWVETHHYWVYYSVQVRNILESITKPGKDPDNYINASFVCDAYIKNADGSRGQEISNRAIVSTYTKQDMGAATVESPDDSSPDE